MNTDLQPNTEGMGKMRTTKKLAVELEKAGAPQDMIQAARDGYYDDYLSDLATPIHQLVKDATKHGLNEIAERAKDGEFDTTKEESQEWFEKEGKNLI